MNIVYLNHYAGSPAYGMEYRPYYLAREWVRLGHRVHMLGADFSHVRARQPQRPADAPTRWSERIDGIDYQWYATPPYSGNGVPRVRNIASFLARVALDTRRLVRECRPDVVIASSTYPMDIWVARRLARAAGAKLVFEVHDLWPLSPIEIGGMSPSHPFIRVCQAAENAAYRDADLVVSMLPNVAAHAAAKGLPAERLAIVPNGISLDEWRDGDVAPLRADVQAAIDAAHAAGEQVVAYTGSHGLPNALDTLLDAAKALQDQPLRFILVGDGHERERLLARVRDEELARVQMFAPVPKAQMIALLFGADMAYLGAPRHPIYRFGVSPNKMIDYMMARVPILYAIEAGNNPIAEAHCGVSLPAENPVALVEGIRTLAALSAAERQTMGENGRRYALSHLTYDVLARSFLDSINDVNSRI
jgi:glycosyltransferase involved in cell wall biosynthesis